MSENKSRQIGGTGKQNEHMDCFYFYSKSVDKKPGKGVNEFVEDPDVYQELSMVKHWRRILSNFHVSPFMFNGKTYNSIEHVFQSKKIALVDPVKADYFTLESGHEIGQGDGGMAQKNRKLVILSKSDIAKWFQISTHIMEQASFAKYQQCPDALATLKLTGEAELWHIVSRKKPVRFEHLEKIRYLL
jgi:predicted NAD-dependent protein-ADP-ribosyltransferase YbiA (DUF1768 family)